MFRKDKLRSEEPEDEGGEVQCNSDENLRVSLAQQVLSWVLPPQVFKLISYNNILESSWAPSIWVSGFEGV